MPANNSIWVLRDELLNDAAGHYSQFKKRKGADPKDSNNDNSLYMESMYAVKMIPSGTYTPQQAKNMQNIILNSLVDMLNMKAKVPHMVVVIINDYKFWNNADLLIYQME